jgi:LysR family transcriptional activator of nhaA
MPSNNTAIRRQIDLWMEKEDLHPVIVAEIEDSALMKVFGQAGRGVFPAPTVVGEEVSKRYGVRALGELDQVRERFYAVSPERKIKHPAVACIVENAKSDLFQGSLGMTRGN